MDRIRTGVCVATLVVWAFTIIAPAFIDGFEPSLAANGPILLILAWLFPPSRRPPLPRKRAAPAPKPGE